MLVAEAEHAPRDVGREPYVDAQHDATFPGGPVQCGAISSTAIQMSSETRAMSWTEKPIAARRSQP